MTALTAVLAVLAYLFVTPDYFPGLHTYGVSVGTNTAYCSIEAIHASNGHWLIDAGCQSGQ